MSCGVGDLILVLFAWARLLVLVFGDFRFVWCFGFVLV